MNIAIRYDKGLGNTAVYARLLGPSGFWDFVGAAWSATETADCRAFMPELADSSTTLSWYQSQVVTPPGGPYSIEYVNVATGAVAGNDIAWGRTEDADLDEGADSATAQSIQFLLSQVRAAGSVLSGGQVFFYGAGTTTLKTVWLDRFKTVPAANPYTLDTNGTAHIYGDGVYRIVIKDSTGTVRIDRDYLSFRENSKSSYDLSRYESLAAALTAIGSSSATLQFASDIVLSQAVTVPANVELVPSNGARINHGVHNFTYLGSLAHWPLAQMFIGTGAVSLAPNTTIYPKWFGTAAESLMKAVRTLDSGSTLDMENATFTIYEGVSGTASTLATDAIPLADTFRLYGKSNVTIQNGSILTANPGVTGTKSYFPSAFTIDGCTGIKVHNVVFSAKGESYGDSDASVGLGREQRRAFLAQNGGHAMAVIRSSDVRFTNCRFLRAGSTGAFYQSSSDKVELTSCYSSPMSLGYAAYAADDWCGTLATSGYSEHRLTLNNCSTDANGATYGSKGGVVAEGLGTVVIVNGGHYADAWANGTSPDGGAAFSAGQCTINVTGAHVKNCAAYGRTGHATANPAMLTVSGGMGEGLRTAFHILSNQSYGVSTVNYSGTRADITGTQVWAEVPELAQSTIVANRKVTSQAFVTLDNCDVRGAKRLSHNASICYGGVRIVGGYYEVVDTIFTGAGWGGSAANTGWGYQAIGPHIRVTSAVNTNPISETDNLLNTVACYRHVEYSGSTVITSALYRRVDQHQNSAAVSDLMSVNAKTRNCGIFTQNNDPVIFTFVSSGGVSTTNHIMTLSYKDRYAGSGGNTLNVRFFDDLGTLRTINGIVTAVALVNGQLEETVYVTGITLDMTVGRKYTAFF